jgi:hypothetical protein
MSICETLTSMIMMRPDLTEIAISDKAAWELSSELAALSLTPKPPSEIYLSMKDGTARFMDRSITVVEH